MSLREQTLFGVRDRVETALERLRTFEPPEGYYLAFSGGKDSTILYDLALRSGVRFDAHMMLTTVDPPELLAFVRQHYAGLVELHQPARSMWALIRWKRFPPMRTVRFCCQALKEGGGDGRRVLTGVRWEESVKRSSRAMIETSRCRNKNFVHPIIDWSEADVWEYIHSRGLPYCTLYDEGFTRIGCIGCPMSGAKGQARDFARWPGYRQAYLNTFARVLAERERDGKGPLGTGEQTPEGVMARWTASEPSDDSDPQQCMLDLWV